MTGGHDPQIFSQARRGFTLVELVIVVVLIGIVGTIAVPRFAAANARYRADAAADVIADALRDVSFAARSRSDSVRCVFDTDRDQFSATVVRTGETIADFAMSGPPYAADITAVSSKDGTANLDIDGLGEFNQSFDIRIAVDGERRAVMLNAATGEITVGSAALGDAFSGAEVLK